MHANLRRALLALAPWPFVPSFVVPRLVRQAPRTAAKRAAFVGSYAAALAGLHRLGRGFLAPLVALNALATAAQLWQGRPSRGARKGWPPGRLPLIPVASLLDHAHVEGLLRRHGRVAKGNLPRYVGTTTACVHGLELGAAVLRNEEEEKLRWPGILYDKIIPAGFLRSMAPADHTVYRRVLNTVIADAVVDECRPALAAIARDTVDGMAVTASLDDAHGVDPRAPLRAYVVAALARLFFGIEPGSAELERVRFLLSLEGPLGEYPTDDVDMVARGARELEAIVKRRAAEAANGARPTEAGSSFAAELGRSQAEYADDPNVTLNLVFIFVTAVRDVTGLLHWLLKMIGDAPEWQERVREDGSGDVASWIVLETLRLEQSEFIIRRVVEPVDVDGYTIPAGWLLRVCVRESHRTGASFPEPEVFDPGRFADSRYKRSEYAPFGLLRHACIGVATTMAVAEELVTALTDGHRLVTVSDGAVEYDNAHWRPSTRHRIRLAPLPA